MCWNLKSDDYEEGSANNFEDDSVDDVEEDDEEDDLTAMAKWFMYDEINPNIIKNPDFKKFMRLANPDLPLPLVGKEIIEIHDEYKEKAKIFLRDFEGKLTLSYDRLVLGHDWTRDYIRGPILYEDFTCLAAHFIDNNWTIQKWILRYTTDLKMPVHLFRSAVQDFEIGNKVSTLLLPNEEDFDEESLSPFRKWIEERADNPIFLLYCCADLFRLMVNDVYETLGSSLIEDVRLLVGWPRRSSTHWDDKLHNLQRAVKMKAEEEFSKNEIYDGYDKPSDEQWIQIQTFCKLTGCIYKVAKELFEERDSTSNSYFHLLAELKLMLNQEHQSADNDYFLRKAQRLLKRFNKYWKDMFLVLATASVLDPRFKTKYLEFYCSKVNVNDEGSKLETVLDYLRSIYAHYAASDILSEPIEYEEVEDDEEVEEEDYYYEEEEEEKREAEREKEKNTSDGYKQYVLFQEFLKFEGTSREYQESELHSYLKEPVMEWNKDFEILEFWKEESQKYPILSRIARDILSIPISRVTSYEAYVSDKNKPPEFVVSINPKVTNAMMCGKSWLRL